MGIGARLDLRQGQQLVMTPQLQQAIRLLQLSNLELTAFVEAELERNPLLEREEGPAVQDGADTAPTAAAASGEDESWLDEAGRTPESPVESLDADAETVYPDSTPGDLGPLASGTWSEVRQRAGNGDDEGYNLEAFVANELSLKDHLLQQLPLLVAAPVERLIGRHLIDMVEESGYLGAGVGELSAKLGAPEELVEAVLTRLQTMDPPGVMARGLAECLALQLKDRNRYDPLMAALLDNLGLLASHNLAALRRAVGVEMDELVEMIAELKQLDPKPGLRFGSVPVQPVVPDVLVRAAPDGGWHVELNSDTLPRVLVNRVYYARVVTGTRTPRERDYLVDCLQTANWLVKSLDQRARTILRVSEEIVRQQDAFFANGVQYLRPLNLKTVAGAINMHESTVSRVTSNKYMATPRGIFEFKYFFTSAIAAAEGEAHSSESVRHRIRQLIDAESPCRIMSDDQIVEHLRTDGVEIARRTVAKYREAMRIPSSVQRRREKRLAQHAARPA